MSNNPVAPKATTGVEHAIDSIAVCPKASILEGTTNKFAALYNNLKLTLS